MQITVTKTSTRDCCLYSDDELILIKGTKQDNLKNRIYQCKHCNKKYVYRRKLDAAGSLDWEREIYKA